ncbi:cell division protein SepF [Occultella aeris]|uniref:Cell division protein SepF n=1 Tax=Occultella aeris TaxID=2761496 RepID=A0A7M4DPZ4_9MICO|nr:cell division protein SepF [Occultella aeris]VZO39538.1 Cell division protein SepF [Occultella aeris]
MAGALRKTMMYLGLSEADRESAYDDQQVDSHDVEDSYDDYEAYETVEDAPAQEAQVTPITRAASHTGANLRRITTVHPRTYNDAKVIGEAFRSGTPVIMNLTDMTDAEAKRLVDFSAGLVFGLRGAIERVTSRVFLLSPATVEVATESHEPEAKARFFNQS